MSAFVLGFLGIALSAADLSVFEHDAVWRNRVVKLASLTLGVYLIHPLIVNYGARRPSVLIGLGPLWSNLVFVLAVDVITVVVAFALAAVLKRWRFTSRFV